MDFLHRLLLTVRARRGSAARRQLVLERARSRAKDAITVEALQFSDIPYPIWLRPGGDDYYTFIQVLISMHYEHGLEIDPKVIIDAGGNIGLSAIYFANKYPGAQIIAVEPDEANFNLMQKNTAPYPAVQCLRGAVWPSESLVAITDRADGNPAGFRVGPVGASDERSLRCYTPLSLLKIAGCDRIDIFKIDIEGAELELFDQGTEQWLGKVDLILAELHDSIRPGCGEAFFRSICQRQFQYYQRAETTIVRFGRPGQ